MTIRREIIKQYISSLKEDGELDYIFPLLLERMGYHVLSTPRQSKGQSQYGRDVVATKSIKGVETLFLFELKGFAAKDINDRTLTVTDGLMDSLKASKYTDYSDYSIPGLSSFPRKYVFVHNGEVEAKENGYGFWCENGDLEKFNLLLDKLASDPSLRNQMGENGYKFLEENYTVEKSYEIIMRHFVNSDV